MKCCHVGYRAWHGDVWKGFGAGGLHADHEVSLFLWPSGTTWGFSLSVHFNTVVGNNYIHTVGEWTVNMSSTTHLQIRTLQYVNVEDGRSERWRESDVHSSSRHNIWLCESVSLYRPGLGQPLVKSSQFYLYSPQSQLKSQRDSPGPTLENTL